MDKTKNLAEVVVIPGFSYVNYTGNETTAPSLEEYKQSKRDEMAANAVLDMRNTNEATYPVLPNWFGQQFRRIFGTWYDDEDAIFLFGKDKNPLTCITTVTDKYGRIVPGNLTFKRNYRKFGFDKVPKNERRIGDIVQVSYPRHAALLTGFDQNGKMLIDQSDGHDTIYHNVNYYDTDLYGDDLTYYRFVGNDADNKSWENTYKYLYNK